MEDKNPCNGECWKICPSTDDCLACFRTRNEINRWWNMSSKEKQEVLRKLNQRRGGDRPSI